MKRLNDIKNEVAKELYGCSFLQACRFVNGMEWESMLDDAAKRYAQQACEDLRERIADNIRQSFKDSYKGSEYYKKIINTEIILP